MIPLLMSSSTLFFSTSYRRAMASRATPPHQLMCAWVTDITPFVTSAPAGEAARRESSAARVQGCLRMVDLCLLVKSSLIGRNAGAVESFELAVGVDDSRQLFYYRRYLGAREGEVEFVVGQVGVDAVADAAESGDAVPGAHGFGDGG